MTKKTRIIILKAAAILCGLIGIAALTSVVYPMLSYKLKAQQRFTPLLDPLVGSGNKPGELNKNYNKPSEWFEGSIDTIDYSIPEVSAYSLSIPKLKISSAVVTIGGEDLSKSLIQYPGTAVPGKLGNTVIFGHSTLPSFYDPKDYISIFSTLPTLDLGDEILVNYDGVEYLYEIEEMLEVTPADIQVLQQNKSDSFITLVTCTPPGDPRKPYRLIVKGRVVPPR